MNFANENLIYKPILIVKVIFLSHFFWIITLYSSFFLDDSDVFCFQDIKPILVIAILFFVL